MSYKNIGKKLQIEIKNGNTFVHDKLGGGILALDEGLRRFNTQAELEGLGSLRDPKGYMTLDGNVYQAIKDTYEDKYNTRAQAIEDGLSIGTTYAMDAVLDKLNAVVRKDSKHFTPKGMVYGDLRFVKNTPDIQQKIDTMVERRVHLTLQYSVKKSIDDDTFKRSYQLFHKASHELADAITNDNNNNTLTR